VGGRERDFGKGDRALAPPNVPHAWRNPSAGEELRIVSELRPALQLEAQIEVGVALARDLKTDRKNAPKHLPRTIMLVNEAKHEFYLTAVPRPARVAFAALLGALAYVVGGLGCGARPVR